MPQFHSLKVTDIKKTIRDAVVVTLAPSAPENFDFVQGQYLTFRRKFDGEELRRSYSICAGKGDGVLQVGIKKVAGGAFSTWANEALKVGDTLDAMPPMGGFYPKDALTSARHHLGVALGSGITPILSIIRTALNQDPESRFTLVYANREVNSIMFRDELEDLKNQHMGRLNVIHILKQDAQDIDLFTGRIDAEKCALLFKHWIPLETIDTAFICGPEPMMLEVSGALKEHGLRPNQIRFELFGSAQPGRAKEKPSATQSEASNEAISAKVTLGGETRSFSMPRDVPLLEGAIRNSVDAPFACRAGVCSTCRAKVIEGEVEMQVNHALEDYEVTRGYVLTCQCYVLSDTVVFDYDQ